MPARTETAMTDEVGIEAVVDDEVEGFTETVECHGFTYKFPFGISDFCNETETLALRFKMSDASIEGFCRETHRWKSVERPKPKLESIK